MVKEGYKETALGTIPEDWILYKLEEIISINQGNALSTKSHKDDGYPVFGANGKIGYYNEFSHLNSEVLLTCRGSTCGTINKSKPKSYITNNSMVLSPKEKKEINKEFLYYIMKKVNYSKFITGTGQPQITKTEIKSAQIPIPEVKEQKKIASILLSVDKSIEKTDEVIEETKELKKGLMQDLLTKGIGHSEFKEVRLNTKKVYIPLNWEVRKLEELIKIKNGYSPSKFDFFEDGEYPFIKVNDMNFAYKYISKANLYFNKSKYDLAQPKTIIFPKRGAAISTNKINILSKEAYYDTNVMGLITNDKLVTEYLYYYIENLGLWQFADTTSIPQINNKHIYPLLVPYPSLEEQKKIASILSSVDSKIKKEEEYKAKLERLKKGLMQKLLTGEIRVNTEMEV
jgi:type I restriction enzyme S subunit